MVKAGDDIDREAAPPAENAPQTLFPAPWHIVPDWIKESGDALESVRSQ
jgi:hypothetical protein